MPPLMLLARDVGLASLPLCIKRVEFLTAGRTRADRMGSHCTGKETRIAHELVGTRRKRHKAFAGQRIAVSGVRCIARRPGQVVAIKKRPEPTNYDALSASAGRRLVRCWFRKRLRLIYGRLFNAPTPHPRQTQTAEPLADDVKGWRQ